jgi:hypothetical protein
MAYCVELPNGGEHEFFSEPALLADMAPGHTHELGHSNIDDENKYKIIKSFYDPAKQSFIHSATDA